MGKVEKSFIKRHVRIIVVFAVIAGSFSGIFGKLIGAPSMAIGFWRLTLGLPFFAVPVLMGQRDILRGISKKDLILTSAAGIFLFGHFFSWFNAVKMTNIASAAVLAALHPLVVLVATVFVLKRKVGFRAVMGIVIALLGGTLIAGLDYSMLSSGSFAGDMLAFLAGVCMGLYFAVGHEVRKNVAGSAYVFLVFLTCWICFAAGMAATSTPVFGYPAKDYIYLILMTLLCQIGAHAVFNLCFGYVDSLYVSAWESGEPVFALIMGVIFLGQIPASWEVLGSVIVIAGLLYYNHNAFTPGKEER